LAAIAASGIADRYFLADQPGCAWLEDQKTAESRAPGFAGSITRNVIDDQVLAMIVLTLVKREFRLFANNKIMLVLYLGGPLLYGLLFGAVYSKGKLTDLPVVVVDGDNTPTSAHFIDMLDDMEVLKVKEVRHERTQLKKLFMENDSYATIVIPDRFEGDMLQQRHPEINTYINNTNLLPSGYVNRSVSMVAGTLNAMLGARAGMGKEALHLNAYHLFNPASNYFLFIWPSYLGIILQSVVMVVLAMSFASEFETGSWQALYAQSGESLVRIVASKLIPYWLLSVVILTIYAGYFYLFRQPFPLYPGRVLLIVLLFVASTSFIGMIAGLLVKTQLGAIQFLMVLSLPIYISSGFSWPYDQNSAATQAFSTVFPFMPFVNGFRILLIQHGGLSDIADFISLQVVQLVVYAFMAGLLLYQGKLRAARAASA
jgi:ABC-2 type transport system permease protein